MRTIFLLLVVPLLALSQDVTRSRSMTALVQAERSFAAMSVDKGFREAFMTFFGEDGISFQPQPAKYKEAAAKGQPPANPKAFTLEWMPVTGDVSAAGDLGYTTGPYSMKDNTDAKRPDRFGFYFTVWKMAEDQSWKVAMDIGISTGTRYTGAETFTQASTEDVGGKQPGKSKAEDLKAAEERFDKVARGKSTSETYLEFLDRGARLHREGMAPISEWNTIEKFLATLSGHSTHWETQFAEASRSNDLGYTYGSYETSKQSAVSERGYYGRVWKRGNDGQWRIIADITNPLPADQH